MGRGRSASSPYIFMEELQMEKHYFVPVINRIYTNRNDRQYRCTGVVESSRPWETVAYFTRLSDG